VISMRELIAWRQEVPWTRDALVEQDLLLTRVMAAVFTDPFLESQVAMRGGTVLHKVHLPPAARYSEDIDLVVGERPVDHVRRALLRVLERLLGPPTTNILATVQLAIRNLVIRRLPSTWCGMCSSPPCPVDVRSGLGAAVEQEDGGTRVDSPVASRARR
jgi:hypothetical protein